MRTILDLGRQGAESMDVVAPTPSLAVDDVSRYASVIKRFPVETIDVEVNDGTLRSLEVRTLLLANPTVFSLLREMAMYEPLVYARQSGRTAMGILSPNFDTFGENRLPGIKVLTLQNPDPLIGHGADLVPDAKTATMLAGSAHAEGLGSGSHQLPAAKDYEHKLTIMGAVSLGKNTILSKGQHVQHAEKATSSVATGLTNGTLGNIFVPNGEATAGFGGYGMPMFFEAESVQPNDAILLPDAFLHSEQGYGITYDEASYIAYGAALEILGERIGKQEASSRIREIAIAA